MSLEKKKKTALGFTLASILSLGKEKRKTIGGLLAQEPRSRLFSLPSAMTSLGRASAGAAALAAGGSRALARLRCCSRSQTRVRCCERQRVNEDPAR